jgi:hypothetical protein
MAVSAGFTAPMLGKKLPSRSQLSTDSRVRGRHQPESREKSPAGISRGHDVKHDAVAQVEQQRPLARAQGSPRVLPLEQVGA